MATPITPKFYADTMVLETITINYRAVWDGAAWVITPADVRVIGVGQMAETGVSVQQADIVMAATDLPAAGQTAINELNQYVEAELAAKYS